MSKQAKITADTDAKRAKKNFSVEVVGAFTCELGKQQSIYWDKKTSGLGLRVTAAGTKAYIFETRLHGKTLRITIGSIKDWSIGKAQKKARELKVMTDSGIDPRLEEKKKNAEAEALRNEEKRKRTTLADLWPEYLEYGRKKLNKRTGKTGWSATHLRDHIRLAAPGGEKKKRGKGKTTAGPLARLMRLRLSELTSKRIADWLTAESEKRPTSAAQSYRLLRAFIRWADEKEEYGGLIPTNVYKAKSVQEAVPRSRETKGDCLEKEQLPVWFESVRALGNPIISAYLQALLITGARREEMASLRWEDVDFRWEKLSIRDKAEGKRTIPLTPYLASLLYMLPRRKDKEGKPVPWVFSSPTAASGRLTEPRIAHNDVLANGGLPHVTLHGLRRSFATLSEWVECPAGITAQIMGHKPSAIAEKHYIKRTTDLLRKWHEKIEAWMLEQAGIKFDATNQVKGLHMVK